MFVDQELAVESAWKPWTPQLGQRVRIRLSEECPALRARPNEKEHLTRYHSRSETGRIGTVVKGDPGIWQPRQGLAGHEVLIDFTPDSVHFQGCISFCALYFAAEELEPAPADEDKVSGLERATRTLDSLDEPTVAPRLAQTPHRTRRQRREARRRAHQHGSQHA